MKEQMKKIFLFLFLFIMISAFSLEVPPIEKEFCHDIAGFLTKEQVQEIERLLKDLNAKTKVQLALLTIPSLEDEVIEDYSIRVVKEWKLGDKKANSGALLLVAKNEKKVRIEVGYGLEGVVTDAISSRIIRDLMRPAFKKNDYYAGIKAGLQAISAYALQDETLIKEVEGKGKKNSDNSQKSPFNRILFFIAIVAMIIGLVSRKKASRKSGRNYAGNMVDKIGTGIGTFSSMAGGVSSLFNKDDSSNDGPLGGGGSFGGGGATGGW